MWQLLTRRKPENEDDGDLIPRKTHIKECPTELNNLMRSMYSQLPPERPEIKKIVKKLNVIAGTLGQN